MTDDDIKRLKRLAEQATPGPWRVNMKGHSYHEVARVHDIEIAPPNSVELAHWTIDAAYIAAMSPSVTLALLREIDKLRAASRAVTQCRCTLVAQSVGDGCEVCNPQLAQHLAAEAQADAVEALRGVASEHDIGYASGWRSCADEAARIVASHIDRLEPGKQRRMRDALLDLLASMRSILVSQRAAKETAR